MVERIVIFARRVFNFGRRKWLNFVVIVTDFTKVPLALNRIRKSGNRPYIMAILDYSDKSAGGVALHRIVHELNNQGYFAYSLGFVNRRWNERRLGRFGLFLLMKYADPIVLYPEVVSGNPLGARHVARWVLNVPGHIGGDTTFGSDELVFAWSEDFYPTDRLLSFDVIDHGLFNNENPPPKDIDCFYVGKGPLRGVNPLPRTDGMTEITRVWPAKRHDLAALLRRTRLLYTYDDLTMLTFEALLCGCRVILLPENKELRIDDPFWGFMHQDHEAQLARFIRDTQSHQTSNP